MLTHSTPVNMRSFHKPAFCIAFCLCSLVSFSQEGKKDDRDRPRKQYTIEQATSERAQLHTIAFDGLAFLTGSFGADCFFPPGKVADFFGFQYMRDNDSNSLGHNTDFLTRIASNVLHILTPQQLEKFTALAKEQESLYTDFANKRIVLIKAFRESMEQNIPLDKEAVTRYVRDLYGIDAELSYHRAEVMGEVIRSFTPEQKNQLDQLRFGNSGSWPDMPEQLDKRSLSHRAHVGVMTYASELFSWYKGSLAADVYFCPERHGTYFGGFYLKDYPAMGNRGYSISTSLTGESGKSFLELLNPDQRKQVEALPSLQKKNMDEIVTLREKVSANLRKFMSGERPDKTETLEWIKKYGEQDAALSILYVTAFSAVHQTLTADQKQKLKDLRNLDAVPSGIYIYSDPAPVPANLEYDFLLARKAAPVKKAF